MLDIPPLCAKQRSRIPFEMKTDSKMKPYRGACTDKNWSNTTTCPNLCNDGKYYAYSTIVTRLSSRSHKKNIEAEGVSDSVYPGEFANIYHCPDGGYYCNLSLSSPCQSSTGLVHYTKATILGAPPIPSTKNTITPSSPIVTTFTSVTEPTASVTLTNQPTCTDIVHQPSLPLTAIGVGLGIPFGIAAIGFLIFLFWRDARRKNARGPKQDTSQDMRNIRHNTLDGGEMDGNGLRLELQGTIVNPELYGSEMIQ